METGGGGAGKENAGERGSWLARKNEVRPGLKASAFRGERTVYYGPLNRGWGWAPHDTNVNGTVLGVFRAPGKGGQGWGFGETVTLGGEGW